MLWRINRYVGPKTKKICWGNQSLSFFGRCNTFQWVHGRWHLMWRAGCKRCRGSFDNVRVFQSIWSQFHLSSSRSYSLQLICIVRAFVSSLQNNPNPTYDQLLDGLLREMKKKGFHQKPQLSSSQVWQGLWFVHLLLQFFSFILTTCIQEFDVGRPFLMNDALPNSNCLIGRTMRKKFKIGSGGGHGGGGHSLGSELGSLGTLLTAMLFS